MLRISEQLPSLSLDLTVEFQLPGGGVRAANTQHVQKDLLSKNVLLTR